MGKSQELIDDVTRQITTISEEMSDMKRGILTGQEFVKLAKVNPTETRVDIMKNTLLAPVKSGDMKRSSMIDMLPNMNTFCGESDNGLYTEDQKYCQDKYLYLIMAAWDDLWHDKNTMCRKSWHRGLPLRKDCPNNYSECRFTFGLCERENTPKLESCWRRRFETFAAAFGGIVEGSGLVSEGIEKAVTAAELYIEVVEEILKSVEYGSVIL